MRFIVTGFMVAVCGVASADSGWYAGFDLAVAVAPDAAIDGTDNDWSTRCDLIINPQGLELEPGECASQPPLTSWSSSFDGGNGPLAAVAVGYGMDRVGLEGEYVFRSSVFESQAELAIFDTVTLDKQDREIELAESTLDDLSSHSVFANAYYHFGANSEWRPYVGLGVGMSRITFDYGTRWKRNDDPERITTFMDPGLRAKVAGTTTTGDARHTDTLFGFQFLAGMDYALTDAVTLGVKLRWADYFSEFEGPAKEWDQLRSHESTVGRGERIVYRASTDDVGFWAVGLSLKANLGPFNGR